MWVEDSSMVNNVFTFLLCSILWFGDKKFKEKYLIQKVVQLALCMPV